MDDMKRLIEKYKQELMEYSRAAAPKEKLEFPEMIGEDETVQTMSGGEEAPAAVPEAPPEPPAAPPEQEEQLNCQGEPIPAAEAPAPQPEPAPPAESDDDDLAQDYEELTPVNFDGNIGAPDAPRKPARPQIRRRIVRRLLPSRQSPPKALRKLPPSPRESPR